VKLKNKHADIFSYIIYAYIETSLDAPSSDMWKEIGRCNALPLPMICRLTRVNIILLLLKIT
jgi:hypothetical protein